MHWRIRISKHIFWEQLYFLKWCPIFDRSQTSPIFKNSKISFDYSWFIAKKLSNFVSLLWKLLNRYCHNEGYSWVPSNASCIEDIEDPWYYSNETHWILESSGYLNLSCYTDGKYFIHYCYIIIQNSWWSFFLCTRCCPYTKYFCCFQ